MLRNLLSLVGGYFLWTGLWLGGNALLFSAASTKIAAEEGIQDVGTLLGVLGLSVVCSLCAGFATAKVASHPSKAVSVMALLLLITGIFVQSTVWNLMPIWYHVFFLLLFLPMARIGGRIAKN